MIRVKEDVILSYYRHYRNPPSLTIYEGDYKYICEDICIYKKLADDFIHKDRVAFTGVVRMEIEGKQCYLIVTDSHFNKLPKGVRRFLLYHEIGHCFQFLRCSEIDEDTLRMETKGRLYGKLPISELNADAYAASILGVKKASMALKWLAINTDLPLLTKIELVRRIISLETLSKN